ncbi:bactofilin family protein [Pararhodospirillum oryzae]|uniref:bactofilin family protein n=1 Tax=Pararhodospirillum oryzae TaxID=478448 RepID=UPI001FE74A05|nr:polymer-forming cytoskeletal protein [Pararhodospirillum oryzae]
MPSIISADLTVTGDLSSAGEIQIDGRVEGDIRCASLIIGISGSVTGEIRAERLRMHGSISGQVYAKSVFLASTARMTGDITHESLAIEPGAFMEGHCRRSPLPAEVVATDAPPQKRLEQITDAGLNSAAS